MAQNGMVRPNETSKGEQVVARVVVANGHR